jgi:hypothetical protein
MRRVFWPMIGLMALLLPVTITGAAQAATAIPASNCGTPQPQRCDDLLQNQAPLTLNLGNSNGNAILFTNDGSPTQRWDIYQLADGNYVIYSHGTNNVLTRGGSCDVTGATYLYCAIVEPQGNPTPDDQQWIELSVDPFMFQSLGSGGRCLDNPNGVASPGQRAVLFPCDPLNPDAPEDWLAKSSE